MPLNPLLTASIVSGAAGLTSNLLGGLFGKNSQDSANRTNILINRENNQFAAEQAQINRNYQTAMWNKSNEYNSALSQRQRLEAAGLNPYLMMNGGNAGSAQAVQSSAAAPVGNAHVDSFDPSSYVNGASNSISGAINSYYSNLERSNNATQMAAQSQLMEEQARNWRIKNTWENIRQQYEINKLSHDSNNAFETYMLTKARRKLAWENFSSDVTYRQNEVNLQNQQQELNAMSLIEKHLNNSILQVQLNYLPQQMRAQINSILADASYKYSLGSLTRQQAKTEVYRTLSEMWNADKSKYGSYLTHMDYIKTSRTLDKTIDSILNELENNKTFNTAPGFAGELSRGYTRFANTILQPIGKLLAPAATVFTKK
ncbi:MAG: DNA pilot protein [Microviridae sp.]|nr:MAG: DNA pilot protein [Microviridae sp.]